jgi:hypothetical protein
MRIHAFVDLTGSARTATEIEAAIAGWQQPERLGALADRVTVVTRSSGPSCRWTRSDDWAVVASPAPIDDFNAALERAASEGAALLILHGEVDVGVEAIGVLRQQLERDPMFGFSVPRVCCDRRCCIARLTRNGTGDWAWVPRSILGNLPERTILVETASPCVLVSPQVVANFGPLDPAFGEIPPAMLQCMAAARRCGFRTIACHRAVVTVHGLSCDSTRRQSFPPSAAQRLRVAVPDLERSWNQFGAASAERFEELYSALPHAGPTASLPSILMDIRNVAPVHNGTSRAVLGLVQAFRNLDEPCVIALLATEEGAAFHDLARAFPGWRVHTSVPDDVFSIAFRPSQPWRIQEMIDLHGRALINVYLLLDTISWDVAYCAPPHLEGVWQFLAAHADGLLYDSEFTRQRFLTRFPAGANVPGAVTHFSFDPSDYINGAPSAQPESDGYVLVVGNHLDHKDVRLTARTIATAFPYREIHVLGSADVASPSVSVHPSGALSEDEVHKLFASAGCVVYPSFYEGFGFPILMALAYGRTVLVRRSALVEELAPFCHGPGRLIMFDRREDLVELIGRSSSGDPLEGLSLAGPESGPPRGWRDVALDTQRFLSSLMRGLDAGRWASRDRTISQLTSYRA